MEINEIKQRLNILAEFRYYHLQPDKNNMLKCSFHADDKPSLKVYPNTNTFNCFGCDANGDVIEFIQKKEKCNKHQALTRAAELCENVKPVNVKVEKVKSQAKQCHTEILAKIFTYFQNELNSCVAKKPKEYLESRNLNTELLGIGYNSGQFHHRGKLSDKDMKACINAGLLIPYKGSVPNANGTTYTAFAKECIMFPLKNKQSQIVSLYGRSLRCRTIVSCDNVK